MMFSLFRKNPADEQARALYAAIVEQARTPYFYTALGVADTVEGRYEALSLHIYAVLRRLKGVNASSDAFAQKLFDIFFKNMDDSLRELGVGDMSIGRKIRTMAEAFYGRVGAYEESLAAGDDSALAAALARNVYGDPDCAHGADLARYLKTVIDQLEDTPLEDLVTGTISFPSPQMIHGGCDAR